MSRTWQRLIKRWRQARAAEQGTAAVEFALILPLMVLVYVGSVEGSALISMDRRVQLVAGALGDLVARADTSLPADTLTDYFQASGGIMTPYPVQKLSQVVTQVEVLSDGSAKVVWSRQYVDGKHDAGTQYLKDAAYELPDEMTNVARGNFVIVAETTYSYLPLYGIVFEQPVRLHRQNFFMPRFGNPITVN
jgi:Flp pilus assembly protein TadG